MRVERPLPLNVKIKVRTAAPLPNGASTGYLVEIQRDEFGNRIFKIEYSTDGSNQTVMLYGNQFSAIT